jgi:hypothetical protein
VSGELPGGTRSDSSRSVARCATASRTSYSLLRVVRANQTYLSGLREGDQPLSVRGFGVEMEITVKSRLAEAAAFLDAEDFPQIAGCLKQEEERAERKRKRDVARRERGRRVVQKWFLEHCCADCGCDDMRILEADHVRGRNFTISENLWRPVKQLEAELALCEARCRNCHAIRHAEDRQQLRELAADELW